MFLHQNMWQNMLRIFIANKCGVCCENEPVLFRFYKENAKGKREKEKKLEEVFAENSGKYTGKQVSFNKRYQIS